MTRRPTQTALPEETDEERKLASDLRELLEEHMAGDPDADHEELAAWLDDDASLPHCGKGLCVAPATTFYARPLGFKGWMLICDAHVDEFLERYSGVGVQTRELAYAEAVRAIVKTLIAEGHEPWWYRDFGPVKAPKPR